MYYTSILLCASAFLIQYITGQSISSNCGCQSITVSSNGGALAITSIGPITPSGIAVATDLGLAGDLDVSGALPYLSAVAFEGQFDTSGSAPVSYGCGDSSSIAITQEIGNPNGNAAASSGLSAGNINSCGYARRS